MQPETEGMKKAAVQKRFLLNKYVMMYSGELSWESAIR